jgi:hypothetical protein
MSQQEQSVELKLTTRQLQLIIETMQSGNVPLNEQQEVFDLVNLLRIKMSGAK